MSVAVWALILLGITTGVGAGLAWGYRTAFRFAQEQLRSQFGYESEPPPAEIAAAPTARSTIHAMPRGQQ